MPKGGAGPLREKPLRQRLGNGFLAFGVDKTEFLFCPIHKNV